MEPAFFGTTTDGQTVHSVCLRAGDLAARLLTKGAVLQSLRLDGVPHDLTLGSDKLADYEAAMRYLGSLVGPVANRISGAVAQIAGHTHRFEANQSNRHTLHSGGAGFHQKIWTLQDHGPAHATFGLALPNGDGGFPGARQISATFRLLAPATLRMEISATTDAPTLMNIANHSYWNLDGTPDWSGHSLTVHAADYLPTTPEFTPTGAICPVTGTAMDFRTPRRILPGDPPLDTNFCLSAARRPLTDALTLTGSSGICLTVATTEPGIQVYDGREAIRPGKTRYEGLAIEAQFWPDAPNHAGFPSIGLNPCETYHQITEWRFSRPYPG